MKASAEINKSEKKPEGNIPEKEMAPANTDPEDKDRSNPESNRRRKWWSMTVRFLALAGCFIAVVVQLNECYQKLRQPPVTTHTRFHVNNSLWYPALTICREPPFRTEVLFKYGLGASPRYTSEWRNFPWGEVTMKQLYSEATYPAEEVMLVYGLNARMDNVELSSSYFFESGACHTLTPKSTTDEAGIAVGYSVIVTHSGMAHTVTGDSQLLGWHVFVHEASETWTERKMQSLGRQEALFIEVGEEVQIRLSVQEFVQTNIGKTRTCENEVEGGEVRCAERCRWEQIAVDGCGAPWLPGLDLPECTNSNHTNNLIVGYLRSNDECPSDCCGCAATCRTVRYEGLPIITKPFPSPMSQIYVFFNSRLVTLMEERPAYDWSTFLAEMGGSLGFLLGLSVLGLISIFEKGLDLITSRLLFRKSDKEPLD